MPESESGGQKPLDKWNWHLIVHEQPRKQRKNEIGILWFLPPIGISWTFPP